MSQQTYTGYMAMLAAGSRLKKPKSSAFYPDDHPIHGFISVMLDTPELFSHRYFGERLYQVAWTAGVYHIVVFPEALDQMAHAKFVEAKGMDEKGDDADFRSFPTVAIDKDFLARVWEREAKASKTKNTWDWKKDPRMVVSFVSQQLEEDYGG